ncbi:hypothetical protein J2T02_001674 [Chitinophaga terrae (ex Kim and Jung 2007)]|uniref:hypothetical protein n=1 Tax=Chitinophaga terrae (ex Kim and Jung 2007) TaxID=408074 RepID=UPI00278785DA|nr:hypothetical protein [Chitinophaga terrae (ex Kim and Jung 2007)]MDQ0106563.1 hypothetical protein [Chitinophaga terrae (ex Kim and Jung 2007)]
MKKLTILRALGRTCPVTIISPHTGLPGLGFKIWSSTNQAAIFSSVHDKHERRSMTSTLT